MDMSRPTLQTWFPFPVSSIATPTIVIHLCHKALAYSILSIQNHVGVNFRNRTSCAGQFEQIQHHEGDSGRRLACKVS